MEDKNKQARRWCFTINNPTDLDRELLDTLPCSYIVYEDEVGEEGTPHIQGYVEFDSGMRMKTLSKSMPRAHLIASKGSAKQNEVYCKKDKTNIHERGEPKQQGRRTDLEAVAAMVKDKKSIREIADEHPSTYIRYNRGITAYKNLLQEDRKEPACVVWLWGDTGVGKTRTATEGFESFYIKDGTQWWDGYEQQECIVIDDFDGKWPLRDMLRVLDRYPYQGQVKGGYVKINSPYIIFTCDEPPDRFWKPKHLSQIKRRLDGRIYKLE